MKEISTEEAFKIIRQEFRKNYLFNLKKVKNFLIQPVFFNLCLNLDGCNLDCSYCPNLTKKSFEDASSFSRLKERIKSVSQKLTPAEKIKIISSFSGEVMLYQKEFVELSCFIESSFRGISFKYIFCTNGSLPLSKEFLDFFLKRNVFFQVSYDFFPELHDSFRKKESGDCTSMKVLAFLRKLRDYSLPFSVRMTLADYSNQSLIKSFNSFFSEFHQEEIQINLANDSSGFISEKPKPFSKKARDAYLTFYLLNRIIFRKENLLFLLLHKKREICPYYNNVTVSSSFDLVSGCSLSLSPRACFGRFVGNDFEYLPKKIDLSFILEDIPKICRDCSYADFCGNKSCIKVKETNYCLIKDFTEQSMFKEFEEKYNFFPLFEHRETKITLYHPFKNLVFSKASGSDREEFIYETDFKALFSYVSGYSSEDFKILLFYNKEPVEPADLLNLSKALKNKNLFIVFVRNIHFNSGLSYKLIIPKSKKDNLDFLIYDSKLKKLITPEGTLQDFDYRKTLIDRSSLTF